MYVCKCTLCVHAHVRVRVRVCVRVHVCVRVCVCVRVRIYVINHNLLLNIIISSCDDYLNELSDIHKLTPPLQTIYLMLCYLNDKNNIYL